MSVVIAPFPEGEVGVTVTVPSLPTIAATVSTPAFTITPRTLPTIAADDDPYEITVVTDADEEFVTVDGPIEAYIPTLLDAFELYLRSPSDYTVGDDVENTGTGGSALDGSPSADGEFAVAPFLVNDARGAVQTLAPQTNELSVGASLWSTPHDDNMIPTTSLSLRAYCHTIGDPTSNGTTDQAVWMRKANTTVPGQPTYDICITLDDGGIRCSWSEDDDTLVGDDVGSGLDPFDPPPIRYDLILATGVVTAYTYDGGDPVTQTDGAWVQFGTFTWGPTTVQADEGDLLFQIAKGVGSWGEVWVDGVLVARFDANEGAPGDDTVISSNTGETWTAGNDTWLFDATRPGICITPASDGPASLNVTDNALLDFTDSDDFTVFLWAQFLDTGGTFWLYVTKLTGNPGSTGIGYALGDAGAVGGLAALTLRNAAFAFAGGVAMVDGEQVLTFTVDRNTDVSEVWRDSVSLDTSDISTVGDMTNAGTFSIQSPAPLILYATGLKRTKLTGSQIATLPTLLGV